MKEKFEPTKRKQLLIALTALAAGFVVIVVGSSILSGDARVEKEKKQLEMPKVKYIDSDKIKKEVFNIENSNTIIEDKKQLVRARIGQGEYRSKLLDECPFCPITLVSDDRLLIASHIKPWSLSNDFEKTDPKNGFMLTPTFDRLFDRGFLSFTNDKKTILSPFLSNMTYSKLGISDSKIISQLPINGREEYLEFHRNNILKK